MNAKEKVESSRSFVSGLLIETAVYLIYSGLAVYELNSIYKDKDVVCEIDNIYRDGVDIETYRIRMDLLPVNAVMCVLKGVDKSISERWEKAIALWKSFSGKEDTISYLGELRDNLSLAESSSPSDAVKYSIVTASLYIYELIDLAFGTNENTDYYRQTIENRALLVLDFIHDNLVVKYRPIPEIRYTKGAIHEWFFNEKN
jgi:hypothetical protein